MTLSFRTYLELESLKKQFSEATETGEFPEKIFAFLSVASASFDRKEPWQNTVFSFLKTVRDSQPNPNLPLIKDSPKEKSKDAPWEYEGRSWAYWSHLLAKAYGWTLEYIGNLEFNDALARVQEILTDEQLDREFQYQLSEIAYPYNKSTKKQHFKPMPRPYWMKASVQPVKAVKFRRDDLPMGLVKDESGMPREMNPLRDYVEVPEKKTKETNPPTSP